MNFWLLLLLLQPAQDSTLNLLVVGDVMLGSRYIPVIQEQGYGYPWEYLKEVFSSADLRFCNLEAPFGAGAKPARKKYTFLVPPDFVNSLTTAGFDLVGLANNHIMDYGRAALETTLVVLREAEIGVCGAGLDLDQASRPVYSERNGIRVAFLAFSCTYPETFYAGENRAGTAPGVQGLVERRVKEADSAADLVVVGFHWGAELMDHPKPYQRALARLAVDAGAGLVVGHHPHVVQGIEVYKSRPIFYSLGNCAFGSRSTRTSGAVILCRVSRDRVEGVEVVPLVVNSRCEFQPRPLSGAEVRRFIERLERLSFGVKFELGSDRGVLIFE